MALAIEIAGHCIIALCQDLLENARLYRFVEACVQTRLFVRWMLKSGELEEADVPPAPPPDGAIHGGP